MANGKRLQQSLHDDDLHHFRTHLTTALLAAGQLGRKAVDTTETRRLHQHLIAALNALAVRLRQIDQRGDHPPKR